MVSKAKGNKNAVHANEEPRREPEAKTEPAPRIYDLLLLDKVSQYSNQNLHQVTLVVHEVG